VTTKVGYQILDKAGYVARIEDADHPPSLPERIDKNEIADIFGGALSAQPDLKDRFSSFILWFESGTTELTRASKQLLPEVLTTIRNRKSKEIYLVGHTDRVGSEAYNLRLSSSRACRVRDLLVLNGVKSKAIIVSFYGKARPLVYTEDETPEPLNRRVEVLIR
jgi:outer membrane protein OmpA-like peptidoglycan-associated protein